MTTPKPVAELTDEELFDEIREQVNHSRNGKGYSGSRTRALSAEAAKRGWGLGKHRKQET